MVTALQALAKMQQYVLKIKVFHYTVEHNFSAMHMFITSCALRNPRLLQTTNAAAHSFQGKRRSGIQQNMVSTANGEPAQTRGLIPDILCSILATLEFFV